MLLFTVFILGFVLSSVKSTPVKNRVEECKDKFKEYEPENFPEDFDFIPLDVNINKICKNQDLNQLNQCTEEYSKENILKLDYEELVKKCGGNKISTAGFGKNISGKKIMCGYVLCFLATFGIVGNVMSMKVFWQPDMWKLKNGSQINQILFGKQYPKLNIPNTLNIVLILWHTQLTVWAVKY